MKSFKKSILVIIVLGILLSCFSFGNVFATVQYTEDLCVGGIATANCFYSGQGPEKAFDDNVTGESYWYAHTDSAAIINKILQYEFDTPKVICKYTVLTLDGDNHSNYDPAEWTFEGSNDNTTWTVLDSQANQVFQRSVKNEYIFSNTTQYKYYRINLAKKYSGTIGGTMIVQEMEMMGIAEAPLPNAPQNLTATAGDSQVSLSWTSVTDATGYNVKRATTAGGPYTTIADNVTSTTYTDTTVTNGTTYYYVVTAVNSAGESVNSNEASATPIAPPGRAILVITMTNGMEKEYDLSMSEVEAFIAWYDGRAGGVGKSYFAVNKTYNKGPFTSRKEYIVFDKILCFEVNEYSEN